MNLKLVLCYLLICFCFAGKAQRIVTEDFVHLKNGKIVHGDIIKDVPGSNIIFLKRRNNSLFINEDTIKVIVRQEVIKHHGKDEKRFYDLRTGQPYNEHQKPIVNKTQDNIYLKNGTTITGHVVDSITEDSILVKINRKDTLVNTKDIDKITRKEWLRTNGSDKSITYAYGNRLDMDSLEKSNASKKKFKMAFTVGGQFSSGWGNNKYTSDESFYSPGISPGITFQNVVSLSAYICLAQMNANDKYEPPYNNIFNQDTHDYFTAQLSFELRIFPLQRGRVSPLAIMGYGTGMGIFSVYLDDGDFCRAGLGIEIKTSKVVKVDMSCTYNYQELRYGNSNPYYPYNSESKLYLAYTGFNVDFIILMKGSKYARTFLID